MWKICPICKNRFYRRTHGVSYSQKYCSRPCSYKDRKPLTEEHKKILLSHNMGNKYSLGIKRTLQQRKSLSLASMGKPATIGMTGKHLSEESKLKISIANKGKLAGKKHHNYKYGHPKCLKCQVTLKSYTSKRCMKCFHLFNHGENHPSYRGGKTSKYNLVKSSKRYKQWRLEIFRRDGFRCVLCGDDKSGNLEADHVKPRFLYPELTFVINNGRTLCKSCHKKTDTFGSKIHAYAKSIQ